MLKRIEIPGVLVVGTDTGVGKTVVAGAIARALLRAGRRVAVLKPAGSGCVHRREGLVCEDAEFLAHCAEARHPLDLICPQRYVEPLAPAVAAQRADQPLDWPAVQRAIDIMSGGSDVMVIEGIGGVMVPMDGKHTFLDVAGWLKLPAVVVARPNLGTINHTLLTVTALRSRGVPVAGVVINGFPPDTPTAAEETNPKAIEKWGHTTVLAIVPREKDESFVAKGVLPAGILAAIEMVDWERLAGLPVAEE